MRNVLVLVMGILVAIGCGKSATEPKGTAAVAADSDNPFQAVSPKTESKAKPSAGATKSASPASSADSDNPFAAVKPKGESAPSKPVKPSAASLSSSDSDSPFESVKPKSESSSTSKPVKFSEDSGSPSPAKEKDAANPFEAVAPKSEPSSTSTPVKFSDKPEPSDMGTKAGTKPNAKPFFSDDDQPKQEGGSDTKAKRPQSPPPIVGTWSWNGRGGDTTIFQDGTFRRANGAQGTWITISQEARQYKLTWGNGRSFIDTVTVSPDGKSMRGKNNRGDVWTVRRRD